MTNYFIATNFTKTIQAAQSVSGAASGVITVGSTTGWATGDLALVSGVGGATGVNGLVYLTVSSGTTFTLKDIGTGATKAFGGSYTSGGTVTHIGYQTAALTLDNTVFTAANPNFVLFPEVTALSNGTSAANFRIHVSDTGDAFVADIQPGPAFFGYGYMAAASNGIVVPSLEDQAYTQADWPSARLGNANNALRANVFLSTATGAAPTAGTTITFSLSIQSLP